MFTYWETLNNLCKPSKDLMFPLHTHILAYNHVFKYTLGNVFTGNCGACSWTWNSHCFQLTNSFWLTGIEISSHVAKNPANKLL